MGNNMSINGEYDQNGLTLPMTNQPTTTAPVYAGSNQNFIDFQTKNINGTNMLFGVDKNGNRSYAGVLPQQQSAFATGLQTGADVVNAGAAVMNAYTGWKGLGLAEDQFNFSKESTNRDVANQAKIINDEFANRNDVGLALGGGAMTPAEIAASKANVAKKYVDGSSIG